MPTIRSLLAGALLSCLLAAPVLGQDVTGTWLVSMYSTEGMVELEVELEQDGDQVTGRADFDEVDSLTIREGRMEGTTLTFMIDVGVQNQVISVEVRAELEGDELTGQLSLPEVGPLPFTAKRIKADGGSSAPS